MKNSAAPRASRKEDWLKDRRISVAPMMDYTDRHCRYFMRLLSPSAWLYTEMVTASAILRGDAQRLLGFDESEHPVALQLGGSDPAELAQAAQIGAEFGYQEINLNCGCPSDRVKEGRFGACLMGEAERVAECVAAMRNRVHTPVTVKCRIGIDPRPMDQQDDYQLLSHFVRSVAAAGCEVFVVHARTAMLHGLSPKENREIPPLRYDVVAQLREEFPHLTVILNGGLKSTVEIRQQLSRFHGVMIGREAYGNPYLLAELHRDLVAPGEPLPEREQIVERYACYVDAHLIRGERLGPMLRPVQGLYAGVPGARAWRRYLSEQAARGGVDAAVLHHSLRIMRAA